MGIGHRKLSAGGRLRSGSSGVAHRRPPDWTTPAKGGLAHLARTDQALTFASDGDQSGGHDAMLRGIAPRTPKTHFRPYDESR